MSPGPARIAWLIAAALVAWSGGNRALALNPALDVSQYIHTSWKVRDGFTVGRIIALGQGGDGYLWLATTGGLYRFDGVRARPWQPPPGQSLPGTYVNTLLGARDGTMWIATEAGLASWKNGRLTRYSQLDGLNVRAITEDQEGTVWAVGSKGPSRLCAFATAGAVNCDDISEDQVTPAALQTDRRGRVWLSKGQRLWRWRPGPAEPIALPQRSIALGQDPSDDDRLLVATEVGLLKIEGGNVTPYVAPGVEPSIPGGSPTQLFSDKGGSLWIGTSGLGVIHVHNGRSDRFRASDGFTGGYVYAFLEDREGDVWVATADGLDRFRDPTVVTLGEPQGLSTPIYSALEAKDGSIWLGTSDGVNRVKDGEITIYRSTKDMFGKPIKRVPMAPGSSSTPPRAQYIFDDGLTGGYVSSLFQDRDERVWAATQGAVAYFQNNRFSRALRDVDIHGFAEERQGLWMSDSAGNLIRWTENRVETTPLPAIGPSNFAADMVSGPNREGLWLGFYRGNIGFFKDGQIRSVYTAGNGLGSGRVAQLQLGSDGHLWAATEGGLSRFEDNRISTLNGRNGLPCDSVLWMLHDDDVAYWLFMTCGLVRVSDAQMASWIADRNSKVEYQAFDAAEGVRIEASYSSGGAVPRAIKARDGKIWFVTFDGVSVLDPKHLPVNTLPPPTQIEQVTADDKVYSGDRELGLPPLTRYLSIDYTALSLAAPDKVRFRYILEGFDKDWREVTNARSVQYTDLAPGAYRFRVIASNNSGVWNTDGASLTLSVAPAYWQTLWFRALCMIAALMLASAVYWLRARSLAKAQELRLALAHANRLATMGQLTASIAHEINQPLAATTTNAQLALGWLKATPPKLESVNVALERIARDICRAADVTKRIRALVKKSPEQMSTIALNPAVIEVLSLIRGNADKQGISVESELAQNLPAVAGDRVQLQQVLLNLAMNALEAMSDSKDTPRRMVVRTSATEPGIVRVSVMDSGPGLDSAKIKQIFEPFYTTKHTGLGLGLSICRSIVEAHGGHLTVTANEPRGAVFQFTIPAAADANPALDRRVVPP